jgi:hypothetical protein
MPSPPSLTFTGPEVLQLRREVLALEHLVEDARQGADRETLVRRVGEIAPGLRYLLNRATPEIRVVVD